MNHWETVVLKPDEREEGSTFQLWGSAQLALTVRAVGPGKQPQGQTSEDHASVAPSPAGQH